LIWFSPWADQSRGCRAFPELHVQWL